MRKLTKEAVVTLNDMQSDIVYAHYCNTRTCYCQLFKVSDEYYIYCKDYLNDVTVYESTFADVVFDNYDEALSFAEEYVLVLADRNDKYYHDEL